MDQTILRNIADIAGIGDIAKPKSQRNDISMCLYKRHYLKHPTWAINGHRFIGNKSVFSQDRRIEATFRRFKAIAKALMQASRSFLICIYIDPLATVNRKPAQIIYPMNVIGMSVGEKYPFSKFHTGIQHLFAKIRPGINNYCCCSSIFDALDQYRSTAAAVFQVFRVASPPIIANTRRSR